MKEIRNFELEPLKVDDLVSPAPVAIAQLAHLVSASMKQLDSAFRHPTKITSETPSTSPLIEYSHSFRTTLLQLSQWLSGALRTANSNADKMSMLAKSSTNNIDNIQRYVTRHHQNPSLLFDLISSPLKRLMESSTENANLASQAVAGFQEVANLTRAVVDTVTDSKQTKPSDFNSTTARLLQLENEISSQSQTIQKLRNDTRQHEATFNEYFNQQLTMWEIKRNEQPGNQCLEEFISREKSIKTDWKGLRKCKIKLSEQEGRNYTTFRDANTKWRNLTNELHAKEEELRQKREEVQQLVLANEALTEKKLRIDKDIALLNYSVNPLDTLQWSLEKLTASWTKLVNHCRSIHLDVSATLTTLADSRVDTYHVAIPRSNELLANNLKTIHEGMSSVGKMTGVYVTVYSTHLADLAAQLEQMLTIMDTDTTTKLEGDLVNACKDVSRRIASGIPTPI